MAKKNSLSGINIGSQRIIEKKLLEQQKTIADMARFPEMNPRSCAAHEYGR